jgi:hypothetical protein
VSVPADQRDIYGLPLAYVGTALLTAWFSLSSPPQIGSFHWPPVYLGAAVLQLAAAGALLHLNRTRGPRIAANAEYLWLHVGRSWTGRNAVQLAWEEISLIRLDTDESSPRQVLCIEVGESARAALTEHGDLAAAIDANTRITGAAFAFDALMLGADTAGVFAELRSHAPEHVAVVEPGDLAAEEA